MTDNQFDNFVRAKLHDHSAPVPAGLWDKVNPAKDDDDRKGIIIPRKFRWGLPMLTLLILAGSVTGYFIFSNNTNNNITETQNTAAQAGSASASTIAKINSSDNSGQPDQPEKNEEVSVNNTTTTDPVVNQKSTTNTNRSITQEKTDASVNTYKASGSLIKKGEASVENTIAETEVNNINISTTKRSVTHGSIESIQAFNKTKLKTPLLFFIQRV